MYLLPADAKKRKRYDSDDWCNYLRGSTEKNSDEDYYRYLRGMLVIRDLEKYEQDYMNAYDFVVLGVK